MQIKKFTGYKNFCAEAIQALGKMKGEHDSVMVAAFYEDAMALIKEFARYDIVALHSLDIQDFGWANYDREYYITLAKNIEGHKGEYALYCEKAYLSDKDVYLYSECDIAYFADDCHSRMLSRIVSNQCYEISFFDDDEYDDDESCSDDCCRKDCPYEETDDVHVDEDMKGFTIQSSDKHGYSCFSFHSTDEQHVKEMLKYYREL